MKKILYLLMLGVFVSCNNYPRTLKSISTDYSYLNGVVLPCDSMIESSYIVGFFDSKIITRYFSAEDIFTVYNCENNQATKIGTFGRNGVGPYEFSGKVECYIDKVNSLLYIFGINSSNQITAYEINLSSISNLFNIETWKQINIPTEEKYFWKTFTSVSDSIFIGLGGNYDKTNLLSAVSIKNNQIIDLNINYPQDRINVKPITKRMVYNYGELLKKPSSSKFLYYCTNWGNYAEIITFEDNHLSSQQVITNDYPIYKVAPNGMDSESEMNTLMGMRSYVTDNYIYLLPNFRNKREYLNEYSKDGYPNNHLSVLYVFNWDGVFERAFKLSTPVRHFVVCPDDTFILGSSDNPDSGDVEFIKFDLK